MTIRIPPSVPCFNATILLLLLVSCCLVFPAHAEITGAPILPGWADAATATGTHCACDAYSIRANDSSTIVTSFVRSIRCQTYTTNISRIDIDTDYTCRCFDMEVTCGYLANSVVYQTTEPNDEYCTENEATASVAFASTAPLCIDAFNQSCGVTAGVRTDTKIEFANTTGAGIYCRKDIVRIDCTTGVCAVNPDACLLNDTYSEWSQCAAIRGVCKKTRVRGIAREAINGAPPCPSLAERTQFGDCTEEECDTIQCKYDEQRVVGPCSKPCGPFGLRNVTWVNISLTQLDRCTEDFALIIEQEEETCPGNPPCLEEGLTSDDNGTALTITCSTRGNTLGYPAYIRVDFGVPITTPSNGSVEFAASFTVLHSFTGRRMPMKQSGVEARDTYVILPFDVNGYDDEGATGDTFYVHFRSLTDLDFSIVGTDGVTIPPFTCLTTDQSPPILLEALYRDGSDDLMITFSENVKACPEGTLTAAGFTMNDITVDGGELTPLYDLGSSEVGTRHYTMLTTSIGSSPRIAPIDNTSFCDTAGNANYVPDTLLQVSGGSIMSIWSRGIFGGKLYSSNNTAGLVDRMLLNARYPIAKSYLIKNSALFKVYFSDHVADGYPERWATGLGYADDTPYDYVDRFILSFPVKRVTIPYYDDNQPSLLNNGMFIGTAVAYDLLQDVSNVKLPDSWGQLPTPSSSASAVLVDPVSIFYAHVTVGDNLMEVDMSLGDGNATIVFRAQDFIYKGANSIDSLVNISSNMRTLTFNMTMNFTSDMLLTDYVYFNGSGTTSLRATYGSKIWKPVFITTFNGTRPAVKTAAVLTQNNGSSISVVSFTFDSPVDSTSVDTTTLTLASSNPLITSVSVTDAIVSDDNLTVSFNISTDCTGEGCYDTSGTFASMSLSGIKDVYGNKMLSYSTASAFDLAPPTIASVIALGKRTLVFKWTESISYANMTNIRPKPVACYGGGSSAVSCRWEKPLAAGTRIYIKSPAGAKIFDLQGNSMLEGVEYGVDLQSVDEEKSCSNPFLDVPVWQSVLVFGTATFGAVMAGYWIFNACRARSIASSVYTSAAYTPMRPSY